MKKYSLNNNNGIYTLTKRIESLGDDFTYTESGNDITVTLYTGNNTDVKIVDSDYEAFFLSRPSIYSVDVSDYSYTNNNGVVVLTKYNGNDENINTPILEEL